MKRRVSKHIQELTQAIRRWRMGIRNATIKLGRHTEVAKDFSVGDCVTIGDYTRIKGKISIGRNTSVRSFVLIDSRGGDIEIGSDCSINDFCVIYGMGNIQIGNDVRIATHTVLVSGNHIYDDASTLIRLQGVRNEPIVVEDNVWIGANVCILGSVTIGSGAVVGAGSVVTKNVPSMSIAVGNPARVIGNRRNGVPNCDNC